MERVAGDVSSLSIGRLVKQGRQDGEAYLFDVADFIGADERT